MTKKEIILELIEKKFTNKQIILFYGVSKSYVNAIRMGTYDRRQKILRDKKYPILPENV